MFHDILNFFHTLFIKFFHFFKIWIIAIVFSRIVFLVWHIIFNRRFRMFLFVIITEFDLLLSPSSFQVFVRLVRVSGFHESEPVVFTILANFISSSTCSHVVSSLL
uniref:Uncharacterized protein n=1 Tax=Cacopsylla melanoneura TaxID=428564 RepID=A0A8D9BW41_9HEMI